MRSVLICQHDASLVREIMPRWLHGFSDVAGIVVIRDENRHRWKKLQKCIQKDGVFHTLDLLAYRLFHRFRYAAADRAFEHEIRRSLGAEYPPVDHEVPIFETTAPNSPAVQEFVRSCQPDVMLACCKHILKPAVFEQARLGTFVMHPGICPEYRNAHGCFWALVNGDVERVGMTMLKIDRGIDTGPVYGYFTALYDETQESHLTIQRRMTYHNLAGVQEILQQIEAGSAHTISTAGDPPPCGDNRLSPATCDGNKPLKNAVSTLPAPSPRPHHKKQSPVDGRFDTVTIQTRESGGDRKRVAVTGMGTASFRPSCDHGPWAASL